MHKNDGISLRCWWFQESGDLFLGNLSNLGLLCSAHLLHSVLAFLTLLAWWSLLFEESVTGETVFWFEFLGEIKSVVDECESSRFATTEVGAVSKDENDIGCDLVHGCKLVADVLLRDRGESRVENVANHLFAAQQTVRHELTSANSCGSHLKRKKANRVWIEFKLIFSRINIILRCFETRETEKLFDWKTSSKVATKGNFYSYTERFVL